MALLITDTSIGVSQRIALCRLMRQPLASDCRIRPDVDQSLVQEGAAWRY
jgi:hypothetical protein